MLKMMGDSQVRDRGREVAGLRSAKQRMARIAMHRQLRSTIVYLQTQPQQVPISCDSTQWRSAEIQHRSEEHTSELQSPCNLVCRLLLEKKKKKSKLNTKRYTNSTNEKQLR